MYSKLTSFYGSKIFILTKAKNFLLKATLNFIHFLLLTFHTLLHWQKKASTLWNENLSVEKSAQINFYVSKLYNKFHSLVRHKTIKKSAHEKSLPVSSARHFHTKREKLFNLIKNHILKEKCFHFNSNSVALDRLFFFFDYTFLSFHFRFSYCHFYHNSLDAEL